ncbi:oligogalacturonide lyase [Planctomycetota bacterium]|nr:oligogalacturonide lyase [Planctomycetota bacterium]
MSVILPAERTTTADRVTGATVHRLTWTTGHSHHLYFTAEGLRSDGRTLLIASERLGGNDLWSVDLFDGTLRQLTTQSALASGHTHHLSIPNPVRDEVYLWRGRDVLAVDLASGVSRALWTCPDGFQESILGCTADGRAVLTSISEDLSLRLKTERGVAYQGYGDWFRAKPLSRVIEIPVDGGPARILHEEHDWLGHVNASPTQANLVTFCHEGPWHQVESRIWGLDRTTGKVWPITPYDGVAAIGHEYWLRDGKRIGWHARHAGDDRRHFVGFVDHDGANREQFEVDVPTQHAHANTPDLVVGDGTRSSGDWLLLWQRQGAGFAPARLLCHHGTSRHHHRAHAHPHLMPDGKSVVFTSDATGYCQVHIAEIPSDLTSLPTWRPAERFYWM